MAEQIVTIDPATGAELQRYDTMTAADLADALDAAARTQAQWAQTDLKDRCDLLLRAATILRDRKHDLAALAVTEMGKPVAEALGEVE